MGGEKLKSSRLCSGVFLALFLAFTGLFNFNSPLYAQTQGQASGNLSGTASPVDESSIILGEAPVIPAAASTSSVWVVFRMVLVLALAALAIYGVIFFIKRLAKPQVSRDPNLKVLARVSLGNESSVAVISLGAKAWLVGIGSGGINLISEIDDAESLETLLLEDARRNAETGARGFIDFHSLLDRFGKSREKNPELPGASHAENLRKQRERLKGL